MLIVVASIRQGITSKNEYPALLFPRLDLWLRTSRSLRTVVGIKKAPHPVKDEGLRQPPSTKVG